VSRTRKPTAADRELWALVGANIRRLRTTQGKTMEALAWAAGASKSYLSRVEAGKNAPSLNMLRALANELEVEPWELLKEPRSKSPDVLVATKSSADRLMGDATGCDHDEADADHTDGAATSQKPEVT